MTLIINEKEAEAVKIIFALYLNGEGYSTIINQLNRMGFLTKRNNPFGKSSIHDVLKNEKYTGVYIYNKSSAKDFDGKYNRHKYKEDKEIIRVEGAIPQIVSTDDFALIKKKMENSRHKAAMYTAKELYLLSNKVICGECGSYYTGNSRKPRPDHPQYVSYRCSKKHGAVQCNNPEIKREKLESFILGKLSNYIFADEMLPKITDAYKNYVLSMDSKTLILKANIEQRLSTIDKEIGNIVTVISKTASTSLSNRLSELEKEKEKISYSIIELEDELSRNNCTAEAIQGMFQRAKKLFSEGTLATNKKLIDRYVDKIIMHRDSLEIFFNLGFHPRNSKLLKYDNYNLKQTKKSQSSDVDSGTSFASNFDDLLSYTQIRKKMVEM